MMELENRYRVIKIGDADKYLSAADYCVLQSFLEQISDARKADGKDDLSGIFIEQDWPEYHEARQSLIDRIEDEKREAELIAKFPRIFSAAAKSGTPPMEALFSAMNDADMSEFRFGGVLYEARMFLIKNSDDYPWSALDVLGVKS